jgi:dTMP kinase
MKIDFPAPLSRFIVFEGGDGAGTTTQMRRLDETLSRAGIAHWMTCEPTAKPEGLLIRRILSGELPRDPATLAHLFAADRNEHLRGEDGILEHLSREEVVVCDRYVLSSLAYQGSACGPELPALLNSGFPLPELLLYFDLEPAASIERLGDRESLEIFEELPFQERVRSAYRAAIARYSDSAMRIVPIDASRPIDEVARKIAEAVGSALGRSLS